MHVGVAYNFIIIKDSISSLDHSVDKNADHNHTMCGDEVHIHFLLKFWEDSFLNFMNLSSFIEMDSLL